MATDLLTLLEGAALTKFIGPAAEHYGKAALERGQQAVAGAYRLLTRAGREPAPVAPNVLVPLVQAAALQDDPALAELWAALLANAADPARRVNVTPSFVEVLRQLAPADAQVARLLYQEAQPKQEDMLHYEARSVRLQGFAERLGLTPAQFGVSIDTLLRLRLAAVPTLPSVRGKITSMTPRFAPSHQVCPTMFGVEFMAACAAPESA